MIVSCKMGDGVSRSPSEIQQSVVKGKRTRGRQTTAKQTRRPVKGGSGRPSAPIDCASYKPPLTPHVSRPWSSVQDALTYGEARTYGAIHTHGRPYGTLGAKAVQVGVRPVSEWSGISVSNIHLILRSLEEKRVIERHVAEKHNDGHLFIAFSEAEIKRRWREAGLTHVKKLSHGVWLVEAPSITADPDSKADLTKTPQTGRPPSRRRQPPPAGYSGSKADAPVTVQTETPSGKTGDPVAGSPDSKTDPARTAQTGPPPPGQAGAPVDSPMTGQTQPPSPEQTQAAEDPDSRAELPTAAQTVSPVEATPGRKDLLATPCPQVVRDAIILVFGGTVSGRAVSVLVQKCRQQAPDAADIEIAQLVFEQCQRIKKGGVDNQVGALIRRLPKRFKRDLASYREKEANRQPSIWEAFGSDSDSEPEY